MKENEIKEKWGVKEGDVVVLFGQTHNSKKVVKRNGELMLQNRHQEIGGKDFGFPEIKDGERDNYGFFGFLPHYEVEVLAI